MSNILFYLDRSVNFVHSFDFLSKNIKFLQNNNFFVPDISSDPLLRLYSHQSPLFVSVSKYGDSYTINNVWGQWLDSINKALVQNKDILLYAPFELNSLNFINYLKSIYSNCVFKSAVVISKPYIMFEQYAFLHKLLYNKIDWNYLIYRYSNEMIGIIKRLKNSLDHFEMFVDMGENFYSNSISNSQKDAFAFLGIPLFLMNESNPDHVLCLKSYLSRYIYVHCMVKENDWPPIDEQHIIDTLKKIEEEEHWYCGPISTDEIRGRFLKRESVTNKFLEELFNLGNGALSSKIIHHHFDESFANIYPSNNDIEIFCKRINQTTSNVLQRRYMNDFDVLDNIHNKILSYLRVYRPKKCLEQNRDVPTLSVLTLTYNHKEYISRCIESVLSQKTKFNIQHIIIDDCSYDGTRDIIKRYASKYQSVRPVLLHRKGFNGYNVAALFSRCRTKYAALCDGDDYFTVCDKLQLQVDFLEEHSECSLCFHPVEVLYDDGRPSRTYPTVNDLVGGIRTFYTIEALLHRNCIQTNSVVYRWRFVDGLPDWFDPTICPGDWYWHLLHAETGLIGYINRIMSVYRRHKSAIYIETENSNFKKHHAKYGLQELRMFNECNNHFNKKYNIYFSKLAFYVFVSFFEIYINTNDSSFIEKSFRLYPEFARIFYKTIIHEFPTHAPRLEKFYHLLYNE